MKNNFTRTNVDVKSMDISKPRQSSFDLSVNDSFTIPFGRLFPVRCTKISPASTFKGNVKPDLNLEKFATPLAGRMRLDTHTFVVPARRIMNNYRQYYESILHNGSEPMSLPSFTLPFIVLNLFKIYSALNNDLKTWRANVVPSPSSINDTYKQLYAQAALNVFNISISSDSEYAVGKIKDWYAMEYNRLLDLSNHMTEGNDHTYGDFIYNLFYPYIAEGSVLDSLGYDIYDYYSHYKESNDYADKQLKTAINGSSSTWSSAKIIQYFDKFTALFHNMMFYKDYDSSTSLFINFDTESYPNMSEMPLRANYAVWYDYFRNYTLEKSTDVLNPDNWTNSSLIPFSPTSVNIAQVVVQLCIPRSRNWSRDGFTMVQPDDVYRHVYAPASAYSSSMTANSYDKVTGGSDLESPFFSVFESALGPNAPYSTFPSSFFSRLFKPSDEDGTSMLLHDLQIMRRANMLESYLKRNYYNPDTFVGQMEARFGVQPDDFRLLTSQYIGGNESMINGEQIISNNQVSSTDVTPVGNRTLMANAKADGAFTYSCSDLSYLISFVSIVPLVHYNKRELTLHELTPNDELIPEFANDNRVIIRTCDMLRDFNINGLDTPLGYVPRYYGYRKALDGVHGKFLREYRSYTWLRDKISSGVTMLSKSAENEHINLPLDCFQGLKPWDTVAFGSIDLPLIVECPLPAKIEYI